MCNAFSVAYLQVLFLLFIFFVMHFVGGSYYFVHYTGNY